MHRIAVLIVLLGLSVQPALALQVGTNVDVSANASAGESASLESQANVEANVVSQTAIETITNSIVVKEDAKQDAEVTVTTSAQVATEENLNAFARGIVKTNATVRDVSLTTDEVFVRHSSSAKLFGLFPITVFVRTTVSSHGDVKVKFPWYASAKAKKTTLESRIQAAVQSSLPSTSANVSAELNARMQAEILAKTVAAIETEAAAEATASVL